MPNEQCSVLSRLADDGVEATGYHEELVRTNFASPVPLLHGTTASAGENVQGSDAAEGYGDFGELLPRNVGFRAACLTFEAERTSGVCPWWMLAAIASRH